MMPILYEEALQMKLKSWHYNLIENSIWRNWLLAMNCVFIVQNKERTLTVGLQDIAATFSGSIQPSLKVLEK